MKTIVFICGGVVLSGILGSIIFMGYMGMLGSLQVVEKEMGPYSLVYDSHLGPYKETGPLFDKVYKQLQAEGIQTRLGLGIYYDDPRTVPADKLRSECGVVLEDKDLDRIEELKEKYQVKTLEKRPSMVVVFPVRNSLSYMLGPMKGYPALMKYARQKGYQISMTYELYDEAAKKVYFVATFEK
ncbi:GyrI-like domain-containing protein [bacterium]|nr:GyrI-like domain-containing protein [bacterium]